MIMLALCQALSSIRPLGNTALECQSSKFSLLITGSTGSTTKAGYSTVFAEFVGNESRQSIIAPKRRRPII